MPPRAPTWPWAPCWAAWRWPTQGWGRCTALPPSSGGAYPAPHGAVCATLLGPVLAVNARALGAAGDTGRLDRLREVARLVTGQTNATTEDLVRWVTDLTRDLGIPGLSAYGVAADHHPELCRQAAQASSMKANPVVLADAELREILQRAG
jgi:alcohol dehydrogenase class IV